jgi:hypothetical protein
MPITRHFWVMDRPAYNERRAIMEVEGCDGLTASREASDCAYKTRFGRVCTAAANGDWEPAREWYTEVLTRFGRHEADELIADIDANIECELKWRR